MKLYGLPQVMDQQFFAECIDQMVKISDRIKDGWRFVQPSNEPIVGYLTRKSLRPLKKCDAEMLVCFEHHIAYNISYQVPVLCFFATKQDGSRLNLDEYLLYNDRIDKNLVGSTLTQMDHPVLCRPFLTLHPCKTREILAEFGDKSKNPLVSWLSMMAPYVDLDLSIVYMELCT